MTQIDQLSSRDTLRYYHSLGSRVGYRLLLKGTNHFGYYNKGDHFWQFSKAMRQMEDQLGKELSLPAGSRVLDAGCGMGFVAIRLADKFKLNVDGIDLLDFNIRKANKNKERLGLSSRLNFRLGDYTKIGLPNSYYDGIYTMETIMHVSNTPACLKKFYKAMKPGGRLVMHEYSHAGEAKMPPKIFKRLTLLNEQSAMPSMQKFEHGVLETMIKNAGFRRVTAHDISKRTHQMVFGFYLLAAVPYAIFKIFGIEDRLTNASAAVFMRRQRKYLRYNVFTAVK